MANNVRGVRTLGMPHGTASARLRKNIMFNLLQRLNEAHCFKCGLAITTVTELSIEHKLPWEGRSAELFWNLNNIAFSHLRCNTPHERKNGADKLRKVGPQGTGWCCGCSQFLPAASFCRNIHRWDKLHSECRSCEKIRKRCTKQGIKAKGEQLGCQPSEADSSSAGPATLPET
jgi:hypothetical protein